MKVLFVCRANVSRSQTASALFNGLSKKNTSTSAGTNVNEKEGRSISDPVTKEGEHVLNCMEDLRYDLSKATRRQLTEKMAQEADLIVAMTDRVDLPGYVKTSPKLRLWDVPDTKGTDYEFHAKVIDQLKKKVESLVKEIG